MNLFDWLFFFSDTISHTINQQLLSRGWLGLLLFGFPFLLLCELPRYFIPALMVLFGRRRPVPAPAAGVASQADRQPCSVLLVGYNEQKRMPTAIDSVLQSDYPIDEFIIVDDASLDGTYAAVRSRAEEAGIQVYRNNGASGRGGRPSATNLAISSSHHELIVSIDADTRVEKDCIRHLLKPFDDPKVGVVAGCLIADRDGSTLSSFQAIEFLIAFGLHRCWLDNHGMMLMASGALGAFRRSAIQRVGAWDPELAEDADISTKIRKGGWKIRFEPRAIATTDIPTTWRGLLKQRERWDRGFLRTFFRKHRDMLNLRRYGWRANGELLMEGFLSCVCGLLLPLYIAWLAWYDLSLLGIVVLACYPIYALISAFSLAVSLQITQRWREDWSLMFAIPLFPFYGWTLRLARIWTYVLEMLRIDYEDPFLPQSAWRNTRRW